MATHDYVIANGTGASVRSDLNDALAAIVSQNSSATAPATTYAYMRWADTTAGVMKMRNGANSAWISLYQLDGEYTTIAIENGTAAAPAFYFKDSGTDTGIYSSGADALDFATGGTRRVGIASTGDVTVYGGNVTLNAQSDLRFADSDSSNWVAFQAPATVSSNVTWTLPSADGTSGQVLSTNGSGTLSWAAAGTSQWTTSGSNIYYTTGKVLVGTSSATTNGGKLEVSDGITFPATQVACSNANTLDDYEEGTWTPTVEGSTTTGTATYTTRTGVYTKVGNLVYVSLNLAWSAGTGTGNIKITGLPFTPGAFGSFAISYADGFALTANNTVSLVAHTNGALFVMQNVVGGGSTTNVAYDAAVTAFTASGCYTV